MGDRSLHRDLIAVAALVVAIGSSGCSSTGDVRADAPASAPAPAPTAMPAAMPAGNASTTKAEADLRRGIASYEDAEYAIAAANLRSALNRGLKAPADKATAHKYLAFIDCASGKMKSCHAQFRNALQSDPKLELAPAEAGHPTWGPVFRNAKLEVNGKARTR